MKLCIASIPLKRKSFDFTQYKGGKNMKNTSTDRAQTHNKWFWAFIGVSIVLVATIVVTIVLGMTPSNAPEIPEGVETGMYYYDNEGTEYSLNLHSGNQFTLFDGVSRVGKYTIAEDGTISFTFTKESNGSATGKYADGVLTFTYNNAEIRFLRNIIYTVSFDTNGGSAIESVKVTNGKYASQPADPTKPDSVFIGWYTDADLKTPYTFSSSAITSDITLYARWVDKAEGQLEYNIHFVGADIDAMTTIGGTLYDLPTPQKDGYTFGGWWISMTENGEKLTAKFNEGDTFTADSTLYALWIADGDTAPIVELDVNGITWSAVENALHYTVTITDPYGSVVFNENVTGTSKTYGFTTAGEYKVEVSATVGGSITAVTERYFTAKALDRVYQFVVVEPSTIVFNKVENAQNYIISIVCGNASHNHEAINLGNSTVYNFAHCEMKSGGIEFTVTAVADGFASSTSATYKLERALNTVTGITVKNDTLTWTPVDNASSYTVKITAGGNVTTITSEAFFVDLKSYAAGEIAFEIVANGTGYLSSPAASYSYTKTTIAAPTGLAVNGNILSWNAVVGENIAYVVTVNGTTYTSATNSIDLDAAGLSVSKGTVLNISVAATDGTNVSAASDKFVAIYHDFGDPISYGKNTVSWIPVFGIAGQYEVKIGNNESTLASGASAPVVFTEAGVVTISVRFVSESYTSAWVSTTVDVYSITLDTRLGSGVGTLYFAQGDYVTLPTSSTRAGYTFNGWYNTSAANGKLVNDGIFSTAGNVVLFANWKPNEYTITYKVDTGVTGVENAATATVLFGSYYTLAVPASDMGNFIGWCTGPNGSGVQLTDDTGKSISKYTVVSDTNVYPMFATNVLEYVERTDGTWGVKAGPAINTVSHVIIPHTYQGKEVTAIMENAFKDCSNLLTVSFPNTVKIVGTGAFTYCGRLENIHVRNVEGVINPIYSSYDGALIRQDFDTTYLEFVPRGKVGSYTIPSNVDTVRNKAFNNMYELTKITVSNGVTKFAEQAIFWCYKLTEIEFIGGGDQPLEIADTALVGNYALTQITFPARLSNMNLAALNVLDNLETIHVEDGGEVYGSVNGILTNSEKDTLLYAPLKYSGDLTIPVGVTAISAGAFAGRDITSVSIASWVTEIGADAFTGCDALISVTFSGNKYNDLTIGTNAFANCASLTSITINGGETEDLGALIIGDRAFAGNLQLQTLTMQNNANVTTIGNNAFQGCENLASLTVPATTSLIGNSAFAQCKGLSSITFTENGKNITFGEYAFQGCEGLRNIRLPSTLQAFDGSVFSGCDYIAGIEVDENNPILLSEDGILYNKAKTTILYFPRGKVVDFDALPTTLTTIGKAAFQSNPSINTLVIPASITAIEANAFENCINLKSVTFADNDNVSIGAYAFANCPVLTSFAAPSKLTTINDYAFYKTAITAFTIPETVTSIGSYAFAYTKLASVHIPASVTEIRDAAFYTCAYLKTVTMAEGSKPLTLGSQTDEVGVFTGSALSSITFAKRVASIGQNAFNSLTYTLTNVTIPKDGNLTTIGNKAFYNNLYLTSITLPDKLDVIGEYAFYYTGLKSLRIPAAVTQIKYAAFGYCNSLATVNFIRGNADLSIGAYAFMNTTLRSIELPARLTNAYQYVTNGAGISMTDFANVFYNCGLLTAVNVADGNPRYSDIDGVFCENDANGNPARVIFCPQGKTGNLVIPATVTRVDNAAFQYTQLSKITFEDIENWDGIPTLDLGDPNYHPTMYKSEDEAYPVFSTASGAFATSLLTQIDLPIQLRSVNAYCFQNLSNASLVIDFDENGAPLDIGLRAFYKNSFTDLSLPAVASLGYQSFSFNSSMRTLTFGKNSTVTVIPDNCIVSNPALTAFEIPASVKKISSYGFFYNEALKVLTFEEGTMIEHIGNSAFASISIEEFVFPESVTIVEGFVFDSCAALKKLTLNSTMKNLYGVDGLYIAPRTSFVELVVPANNPYLVVTEDGVVYSKDMTQLIFCPRTLTEVEIADTVTSIEDYALAGFSGSHLTLPSGLIKLGNSALLQTSLISITIPASVQQIGEYALSQFVDQFTTDSAKMTILREVFFEAGSQLEKIGTGAFAYNKALIALSLPDTVSELGSSAFSYCESLVSIDLPSGIQTLEIGTFSHCISMKEVILHEGLITIGEAFGNNHSLESITIPASVEKLAGQLTGIFSNCPSLKSIKIAEGSRLNTIVAPFLANCPALEEFTFPASIISLRADLFGAGDSITCITILGDVETIPANMFKGFKNLTTVNLPDTVKAIGANAFDGCTNLKNINLPASLTTIGEAAFRGCTALESVFLGDNVTEIGNYAFDGCTALSSVIFGENNAMTALGMDPDAECAIFRNTTALTAISLPDSIQLIGANVFANSGISAISLPENLIELGDRVFSGCVNLTEIILPESLAIINDYAFENCSAVKTIQLGLGVEYFGTAIFMNCVSLESASIPATVNTMVGNPFINCPSLAELDFNAYNRNFKMIDDVLFSADGTTLIFYHPNLTAESYKAPSTVVEFAAGAFYGAQFKHFTLPENAKAIPDLLFYDAKNLVSVTIPMGVTSIGEKAFMGCISLEQVTINEAINSIDAYAFAGCTALNNVTFSPRNTAYTIGAHAFEGCTALSEIDLPEGITALAPYTFANTGLITFILPNSVTDLSAEGVFANNSKLQTITLHDNVGEMLGQKFFMNCTALTEFTMPASVTKLIFKPAYVFVIGSNTMLDETYDTSVESWTFAGCTALKRVDLKNAVAVGAHTFEGCTALTNVVFGPQLAFIGDYAFAGCTSLAEIDFSHSAFKHMYYNRGMGFEVHIDIGRYAFKDCTALTSVKMNNSVGIIYDGAFEGCTALTHLELPKLLHGFYGSPFRGWTNEQVVYVTGCTAEELYAAYVTKNSVLPNFLMFNMDTNTYILCDDDSILRLDEDFTVVPA